MRGETRRFGRLCSIAIILVTLGGRRAATGQEPDSLSVQLARLEIDDVPLPAALTALAARSGVSIAFSDDVVPSHRVSCPCPNVTVSEALTRLLAGTNLRFQVTRTQILIVPRNSRLVRGVVQFEDGAPVSRALVAVIGGPASRTDLEGRFEIEVPLEDVTLIVSRIGIETDTLLVPASSSDVTVPVRAHRIELPPLAARDDRLSLNSDLARFVTTAQTSTVTVATRTLTDVPGLAEADVVRAVRSLPGVVSRNDFSIGYNVRGGEADQNLILLDGVTVLNPSHLGGVFSTFDANALGRATLLTGGFPAEYAGRLSSVLDLRVRDDATESHGAGQISLLSAKLLFTGPIGDGSYLVSGRRTYADKIVQTFTHHDLPYYFTDVLGKLRIPVVGGDLALTGYWGRDVLNFRVTEPTSQDTVPIDLRFHWGNWLFGGRWTRAWSRGVVEMYGNVSTFDSEFGLFPDVARFGNDVRLFSGGTVVRFQGRGDNQSTLGVNVESTTARYEVDEPTFEFDPEDLENVGFIPIFNRTYGPTTISAFADRQWVLGDRLMIRPGVRIQHTTGAGFTGVAPRVAAKLFLNPDRALLASAGRFYQVLQSLRDQDLPITAFEFWVGANERVPVARSDHLVLGFEQWLDQTVQLKIEGYRKTYDGLVIPNRAIALRDEADEFSRMTGDSWGFDLLARKHGGRFHGWFAYGFNQSERTADGKRFSPAHDRRHTINVVVEGPGPLGARLNARWTYGSPLPYTNFVGEWRHLQYSGVQAGFAPGRREPISIGINDARFPAYNRLDLALRWRRQTAGGLRFEPYVQVANVYNRRNVFFYQFDYSLVPARRTTVSQLPIFPTFGVEFSW